MRECMCVRGEREREREVGGGGRREENGRGVSFRS